MIHGCLRAEIPSDYSTIGSFSKAYLGAISEKQRLEFYFDGPKTKFPVKREKREKYTNGLGCMLEGIAFEVSLFFLPTRCGFVINGATCFAYSNDR